MPTHLSLYTVVLFQYGSGAMADVLETVRAQVNTTVPTRHHHEHILRIHNLETDACRILKSRLTWE